LIVLASIDPTFVLLNRIEAGLWFVVALILLLALRRRLSSRLLALLVIALIAFGISDLVETRTGAWYRPWWLLLWKGVCVVIVGVFVIAAWRARQRTRTSTASSRQPLSK
jgi:hypothetical protein